MATNRRSASLGATPETGHETDEVREVAELLARKWRLDVLTTLEREGPFRFNELKRQLGITSKVLTDCLTELTEAGLVERTVLSEAPPHVEYDLAGPGYEMQRIVDDLANWTYRTDENRPSRVLVVDERIQTNSLYTDWLSETYDVDQAVDPAHVDADRLSYADVVLYRRCPHADGESELVERIRNNHLDIGVIVVTVQCQSTVNDSTRHRELVEPVLRDELLQAVSTVLPNNQ